MTTNDDSIKWVVERLQALQQEHEEARRANRVVDHAACRIASESCLQELLRAYDRLDEAQAEIEGLQAEVERLRAEIQPRIERSIAFQDAMEEAEAERDEARAEVERLKAEVDRLRGPHRRCYHCLEDLPQGATDDCCDGCREQLRRDEEAE